MPEKKDYVELLKQQMKEFENQLNELKSKAGKTTEEMKIKYSKELEEIRMQKEAVQEKLNKLMHTSSAAWKDIRGELDEALLKAKEALSKITSNTKW